MSDVVNHPSHYQCPIVYQLDPGAYKPTKAHPSDAGYDLYARMDVELAAGSTVRVDTGVHVLIPDGYVGLVQPRSSYSDAGVLAAGSTVRVDTGAHVLIPDGYVGLVQPRSTPALSLWFCLLSLI